MWFQRTEGQSVYKHILGNKTKKAEWCQTGKGLLSHEVFWFHVKDIGKHGRLCNRGIDVISLLFWNIIHSSFTHHSPIPEKDWNGESRSRRPFDGCCNKLKGNGQMQTRGARKEKQRAPEYLNGSPSDKTRGMALCRVKAEQRSSLFCPTSGLLTPHTSFCPLRHYFSNV